MIHPINPQTDLRILQGQINHLHAHYLQEHRESMLPFISLNDSIALIVGVALAVFSGMSGIAAVLVGVGGFGTLVGLGRYLLNLTPSLQKNKKAADAILSPGFYQYAMSDAKQLSSAERIIEAYQHYVSD